MADASHGQFTAASLDGRAKGLLELTYSTGGENQDFLTFLLSVCA